VKLSLSMALTFKSKQIEKVITLDEIQYLSGSELFLLKDELIFAINSMDRSLIEVATQSEESGEPYNQEWHQRVRRKQKVCQAFLVEVSNLDKMYDVIYKSFFIKNLLKYISEEDLGTVEQKTELDTQDELLAIREKELIK